MDEKNSRKPVKLVNAVPSVTADGHALGLNSDTGAVNLMFFQLLMNQVGQDPSKELEGNMVSSIRLNVEQLEKLNEDIASAISTFNATKTKKKS